MQTVLAARGDARTVVTQFVDGGLDDDRYVVEKSLTRRVSSNPLRRRRFKPVTVCRATAPISTPAGVLVTPEALWIRWRVRDRPRHARRSSAIRSGAARARRCP